MIAAWKARGDFKLIHTELGMFCAIPRECTFRVDCATEMYEFSAPGRGTLSLSIWKWTADADTQAAVDQWWAMTSAMMTPDAPGTDAAGRLYPSKAAKDMADGYEQMRGMSPNTGPVRAASPAGQTIPGGVVDAMRVRAVESSPTWGSGAWKSVPNGADVLWVKGAGPVGATATVRVTGREAEATAPDFGSQVTEALAHGRGIDPGGQGMRVATPEEREKALKDDAERIRRVMGW